MFASDETPGAYALFQKYVIHHRPSASPASGIAARSEARLKDAAEYIRQAENLMLQEDGEDVAKVRSRFERVQSAASLIYWFDRGGEEDFYNAIDEALHPGILLNESSSDDVARSEVRTYEAPVIPQVSVIDTSSLGAKLRVAGEVVAKILPTILSSSKAYASEIAVKLFAGSAHYQIATETIPATFAANWPVFNATLAQSATASTERMVIDQRQGVPDAASVLPLVTFARYNPKAEVVLALIAETADVDAFIKKLAAPSPKGTVPQNFKVRAVANENEFVAAFARLYNSAAPLGKSVALITDREVSAVTQKIGSRRHLLSVVGAQEPLKQTASTLLAADKLLNESIWSMGYHFVSVEKLGGLEALMAELTSFVAAQAKVLASA